ncbi:MAG: hypothetical protein JXR83_06550, partial [Deltaproteobacteria bacterium]|nr:hypothetical protein [Deltaproteobacteria bacterium]
RDERPIWEQRLAVTGSHLHAPLLCPEIDRVRVRFEGGDVRLYEMRLIEATAASPSSEPGS